MSRKIIKARWTPWVEALLKKRRGSKDPTFENLLELNASLVEFAVEDFDEEDGTTSDNTDIPNKQTDLNRSDK